MILAGRRATALVGALLASLALNLFVAGMLLGRDLHEQEPEQGGDRSRHGLAALVPPGAREVVGQRLDEHRAEFEARIDSLRTARRQAFALLRADPFDAAAARAALATLRERTLATQELVHELLIETAQRTPAEVRAGWRRSDRDAGSGR